MRIAVFDTHRHDRAALEEANQAHGHELTFFEPRLTSQTVSLARGFDVACSFVNDQVDRATLTALHEYGVRLLALRSAGYNHVDLEAARARRRRATSRSRRSCQFGAAMHVRGIPTIVTIVLAAVAVAVMAGVQSARIGNASRAAHHRLVLQAHQLRQLLPAG